jgi:polysaccharide export outer membrane protein
MTVRPLLLLLLASAALASGTMRVRGQVTAPETTPAAASADIPTTPQLPTATDDRAATLAPIDPNYLLQPDDVIEVLVFREPDLTTNAIVRKDGRFEMKLLGPIQVSGLTVDQATEAIRGGLAKDYLVSPRVNLSIVSYAKRKVNVMGEVRSPGLYGYPDHGALMLSDAIALAGGLLPTSDAARINVRRTVNGQLELQTVDASASDGSSQGNTFEVRPDDAITIPLLPKRHFTVLGQINRPGDYDVSDDRPIYLTDAIALAGGFTRLADPAKVLLKRSDNGHETVMELNAKAMEKSTATQRLLIQNEDTITVPESMF